MSNFHCYGVSYPAMADDVACSSSKTRRLANRFDAKQMQMQILSGSFSLISFSIVEFIRGSLCLKHGKKVLT